MTNITLCQQGDFDLLRQEAERCDRAFQQTLNHVPSQDTVVQVFSWLVLQGKLKTAVCCANERARGIVLSLCDWAGSYTDDSTVLDVLRLKHPDPCIPVSALFLHCDVLPQVEITSYHVLLSARWIQDGAGPGGCDAYHW